MSTLYIWEWNTYVFLLVSLGPAGYSLPSPRSPAPLIGEKLQYTVQLEYPAPNTYSPSQPNVEGKTFGLRSETKVLEFAPPPNTYHPQQPRPTSAAHFTLRPLPRAPDKCVFTCPST